MQKRQTIEKFKINETDTGSSNVQIALLTQRIELLTEHMQKYPKDFSSKRGLIKLVAERRGHLQYLKRCQNERYNKILAELGLKR